MQVLFKGQSVEPLPRGRHKLSREQVEGDQRNRILLGTTEAAAEVGYGALTVSEITTRARVARSAFYREFANRDEAFLAACDAASGTLLAHLYSVGGSYDYWVDGVEGGTAAMVDWLAENPAVARMVFLEMPAAGETGLAHRDHLLDGYERLLTVISKRARSEEPALPEMPSWVPRMVAGAIIESIGTEFRRNHLSHREDITDRLVMLQLALLGDMAYARKTSP